MSVGGGSPISAQVQLDLGQLKAQVEQAVALTDKLGTSLKTIPSPKLDAQPITHSAAEVQGVVDSLQSALGGLGAPHSVGLDASSLQAAGGAIDPILKGLTGGLVSLGAAAAVTSTSIVALSVGATAAVLQLGEAYDHSFRLLQARTGETGAALEETRTALANLSATSPRSIEQLTAVFVPLKQILGQTADETATTTSQIIKFARAAGVDATQATGDLARVFNAFGIAAGEQGKFLDGLTVAMQRTGISEEALVAGIKEAGPVLRGFGFSAAETTAFVAQLSTAGVEVGSVLRGLRTALGNVTGDDAKAKLEDLFNFLGDTAVDKVTRLAVANANFTSRAGPGLVDLAEKGKLSTASLVQAMDEGAGSTDRAAAAIKTNLDRIGALIEIGKKQWAPYGLAAIEAMDQVAGTVFTGLGKTGQAIDDFLAKPSVRALAAYLQAIGRAGVEGAGPQPAAPAATGPQGPVGAQPVGGADALATQKALDDEMEHRGQVLQVLVDEEGKLQNIVIEGQTAEQKRVVTVEDLADRIHDATAGEADYAKVLTLALNAHQELVPEILRRQKAQDDLTKGMAQLTDLEVKATALTLQHAAAAAAGAEKQTLLAQVSDFVTAHLAAQMDTQEKATAAQRKAEAQVKAVNDAYEKAANEGASVYQKRLFELADAAIPGLTAAETAQLKAMEDLNDQAGLLALVMTKLGLSETDAKTLLAGTNAEFDAYKKQVADATKATTEHGAAVKTLGDFYEAEIKGRASSAISSLASATDAGTAAQAKYLEAQGKTVDALRLLLQQAGVAPAAIEGMTAALQAGGAAAFDAGEKLKALTTYARDASGTVRLKVEIDVEQVTHQIADLQQSYQQNSQKLAQDEAKATAEHLTQIQSINDTFQAASDKYSGDLNTIETGRTKAAQDLTDQIGKASSAASDALTKLHRGFDDALQKYDTGVLNANNTLFDSVSSATKTFIDAAQSQAKAAEQSLRQVTDAQINAFRQVANAMGSFNIAQLQRDAQASITLQASQNAQNSFTDTQSVQSAQRLAQIQQQGQAGLGQVAADLSLNQTRNAAANTAADAEKSYQRALVDQESQAEKTRQTYRDALDKARNANDKSLDKLDDDLTRQLRDFQLQEIAINKGLDKALSQAQTQHKEAMKKLDDQAEAAQKAFNQAAQHHVEQLTQAERQFTEQERARVTEQAQADKHFQEQRLTLGRQLDALVDLLTATHGLPARTAAAIAQVLQLGPQQITQNIQQVAETGVDFADTLGSSLLRRVRSGV